MARVILNIKERVAIVDLLRELLSQEGDGWSYPVAWDDARVAQKAGGRATAAHVAYIRLSLFGPLPTYKVRHEDSTIVFLQERLQVLEAKFDKLASALGGI